MGTQETLRPEPGQPKDGWDKAGIILSPLAGLLTAVTIAAVSYFASDYLNRNQENEAKTRLYTELMSRREESESALRKDMFTSIINSILGKEATIDEKILQLELLAYNFHESLNLTPLFQHMRRDIARSTGDPAVRRNYEDRLVELAREVTRKQLIVLEAGGHRANYTVIFSDSLLQGTKTETLEDSELSLDGIKRRFRTTVFRVDTVQRTARMGLEIETAEQLGVSRLSTGRYAVEFDVGFFSTPMIDNTRLSNDQRVAVVLTDMNSAGASLSLVYFPGSRASLREKPYYEEILKKLADTVARQ